MSNETDPDALRVSLRHLVDQVLQSVWIDETGDAQRRIVALRDGAVSSSDPNQIVAAMEEIRLLRDDAQASYGFGPSQSSTSKGASTFRPEPDQWERLLHEIRAAEQRWQRLASVQFILGLAIAPVVALIAIAILAFLDGLTTEAQAAVAFCAAMMVGHSFIILRIHQQARIAAERLTEKRVAMFFFRLALDKNFSEMTPLLNLGTQMFLGHYAPVTLPLTDNDLKYPAVKAEVKTSSPQTPTGQP